MDTNGSGYSRVVHQATGMVAVQTERPVADALVLIEQRAAAEGRTVEDMAAAVVRRETRFKPPS